ncbi:DUF6089 family protein [Reichenbachiella agarivorans]|uniref:DUF6089 family protein n=1 Tax=Reichenbachiella agarivorans TaxID=2979464 RepID=A0ABY6CUY2_9BACT|nr:DUF6089 family protein [Reichenbachiella agarivorans]UXP33704.1 DUF6089 family protein [Reichenbachiella agarivorans]
MRLKILPILSAFLFFTQVGLAQRTEVGIGIGAMSYSGDMFRGYNILQQNLGVQGHYRINYDKDVSFKFSLLYGQVSGNDDRPFDALGEQRNASFSRNILEGSAVMEFHFLDYKNPKSAIKWSPYLFGGVGVMKIFNVGGEEIKGIQPVIPFGLGFKYLAGRKFNVGVEFGARKTFTDYFDEVSDSELYDKASFQFGNPEDKDWYYFVGFSISYVIFKVPCTYQYIPNRTLYK